MKTISCGLIAWVGLVGVGQAAELLPINSPTFPATPIYMPPSSAAPWTGWNLGAQLGLGWTRNSASATFGGLDATNFSEGGFARLKGGLFGSYDWLIGRYVVAGLEGGYILGGGLEAAVAERWRLRAEYRLKQAFFEKTAPGAVSIGSGQVRDQSVLLGVSYHFGAR